MTKIFLQKIAKVLAQHPKWMVSAAVLYLISPFDLLPEALLGPLGYIEDFVVLLLPYFIIEYARRHKEPSDVVDTTIVP